ncbi:MAG: tRNA uridine-5-carboxymethylaminomethyl(34) synthesis GTPase MnmE [Candidatus Omnitrophica bacterium]|nr:tRNA uridine-5-carboxymethylaminomethyl(34) synthesis GTPase MnmE [Candidatus Omnitrophota bacterium]
MERWDDTIAAISTPLGESGIGIVRISGKDALKIADKIFVSKEATKASEFKTYTIHYGWIVEDTSKLESKKRPCEFIDEVILTVMRAPYSYTREDVVEINCHGGIVPLRKTLELVLSKGARLAEPGEFTKRAFLNGRIDLTQAEAVLEIIRAKTESALKLGIAQLRGLLSKRLHNLREKILKILVLLEAEIDFPEEEIGSLDKEKIDLGLQGIIKDLECILEDYPYSRIFTEGIRAVICGRPNVGKSSLLNALLKQERSIVTPIPGTTRDTIEEIIDIKGIPVRIVDTAGIIEPKDLVEKEAIKRSRFYMELAELIILVFDGSQPLTREDKFLIKKLKTKNTLAVINKIDLKQRIEKEKLKRYFKEIVELSAKKLRNIELLEEKIQSWVYRGRMKSTESILAVNLRQKEALKKLIAHLKSARSSFKKNLPPEFISQDIKDGLNYLDGILGKSFNAQLLDKIFSQFCIGK